MDKLKKASEFEVSIGGVVFRLRRRSTALMLKIGDVRRVFGLLSAAKADPDGEDIEVANVAFLSLQQGVIKHALIAVDGEPVEQGADHEELEPFGEPLLTAFLESGLKVDFTEGS